MSLLSYSCSPQLQCNAVKRNVWFKRHACWQVLGVLMYAPKHLFPWHLNCCTVPVFHQCLVLSYLTDGLLLVVSYFISVSIYKHTFFVKMFLSFYNSRKGFCYNLSNFLKLHVPLTDLFSGVFPQEFRYMFLNYFSDLKNNAFFSFSS